MENTRTNNENVVIPGKLLFPFPVQILIPGVCVPVYEEYQYDISAPKCCMGSETLVLFLQYLRHFWCRYRYQNISIMHTICGCLGSVSFTIFIVLFCLFYFMLSYSFKLGDFFAVHLSPQLFSASVFKGQTPAAGWHSRENSKPEITYSKYPPSKLFIPKCGI